MAETLSEFQAATMKMIRLHGNSVAPIGGGYWAYGDGTRANVTVSPLSGTRILDLKTIRPLVRKGQLRRTNTKLGDYQDTYVVVEAPASGNMGG